MAGTTGGRGEKGSGKREARSGRGLAGEPGSPHAYGVDPMRGKAGAGRTRIRREERVGPYSSSSPRKSVSPFFAGLAGAALPGATGSSA